MAFATQRVRHGGLGDERTRRYADCKTARSQRYIVVIELFTNRRREATTVYHLAAKSYLKGAEDAFDKVKIAKGEDKRKPEAPRMLSKLCQEYKDSDGQELQAQIGKGFEKGMRSLKVEEVQKLMRGLE